MKFGMEIRNVKKCKPKIRERGKGMKVNSDHWDSGLTTGVCGLVKEKPTVYLFLEVNAKIQALNEKMKSKEWLGYLLGNGDDGDYIITDIVVPPQEISTVSVDVLPEAVSPDGCIGVIHSHHTMGTFFSGTDKKYVNSNHNVSIVVSGDEFKATTRTKAQCGILVQRDAEVKLLTPKLDTEKWLEESVKNIKEKKYQYQQILAGQENKCPKCSSLLLDEMYEWVGDVMLITYTCQKCGHRWTISESNLNYHNLFEC